MKKIIVASMLLLCSPALGSPATDIVLPTCCYATLINGDIGIGNSCDYVECTYNGSTRYFTNCSSCKQEGYILTMGGSYSPCGIGKQVLSADYGECVKGGSIGGGDIVIKGCGIGEYGDGIACAPCPPSGTSNIGATDITDCYIPAGSDCSDNTGTCEYTEDCHYVE